MGNSSQSYGASPAMWDHTVKPFVSVARHNPSQARWYRRTYPKGVEGWVDLGVGYIPRWFTCPQTITRPSGSHQL